MARKGENIFKRKDGRWEARYIHHYENGVAKYRYLYAPTYAEAKAKRLYELFKISQNQAVPIKHTATFAELSEKWLSHIQTSVKESTYTRYVRIVHSYLQPHIKKTSLFKMDIHYIQNITELLSQKGGVHGDPLSPKTVSDIICVLKAIFRYGQENGYPCTNITQISTPKAKKSTKTVLPDDIRLLIEHSSLQSQDTTSLSILLTLFTGLRIGEVCGLQWGDFDFKNQVVNIRRTIERIAELAPNMPNKTKVIISEPKTEHSIRTIPLPQFLSEHLLRFQKAPNTYFLTGTSHPTEPHQFYIRYQKYMRRLGIQGYTFHTLRHTFATHCVSLGFDIKSLSEILGHANVSTTLAIYVHPTLEQKRKQMELLRPEYRA